MADHVVEIQSVGELNDVVTENIFTRVLSAEVHGLGKETGVRVSISAETFTLEGLVHKLPCLSNSDQHIVRQKSAEVNLGNGGADILARDDLGVVKDLNSTINETVTGVSDTACRCIFQIEQRGHWHLDDVLGQDGALG